MDIQGAFQKLQIKIESWVDALILMLPNFVVAIVLVILFVVLAKITRNIVGRLLDRVSHNTAINRLISAMLYIIVIIIGSFIALGVLNLDKTVTSLLAGAGIIGLALGFAFQDTFANFISGVIIATRRPFRIGDIVETNDFFGTVMQMNLRTTVLRTPQAQKIIIPNKSVLQNPITNYSFFGERRIDLEVGISYGEDLEKVKSVTTAAIEQIDYLQKDKEVEFFYKEFGDSSINFEIRYWINFYGQTEYLKARSEGVMKIKAAYDQNDITIPFPIRTLDFGIKGGEKLSEILTEGGKNKS